MIETETYARQPNIPDECVLARAELAAQQCIADGLRCSYAAMRERGAVGGHLRIADALDALEAAGVIVPLKLCGPAKGDLRKMDAKPHPRAVIRIDSLPQQACRDAIRDYKKAWRNMHTRKPPKMVEKVASA